MKIPRRGRSALLLREGNGNGPSVGVAHDGAGGDQARERVADALVPDAKFIAELRAGERASGATEDIDVAALEIARGIILDDFGARESEVDARRVVCDEMKA